MRPNNKYKIVLAKKLTSELVGEYRSLINSIILNGGAVGYASPLSYKQARELVASYFTNKNSALFLAMNGSSIVGSIYIKQIPEQVSSHVGEIRKLMVHPSYRNNGLGTALIKTTEGFARKHKRSGLLLDVRANNVAAINLYKKQKFKIVGKLPKFVKVGNNFFDDYLLFKELR